MTNRELRKIIEEDIGGLRAEFRQCLGGIIGDIEELKEAVNEIECRTKPITVKMPRETKWIGYLCKFKDLMDEDWQHYDILEAVNYANTDGIFEDRIGNHWKMCEVVCLKDKKVYKEEC